MQAVARELIERDIIPNVARLCPLGQQVADHAAKLLRRSVDLFVSMQERRELAVAVPARLVGHQGVSLEDGFEAPVRATGTVPHLGEVGEVPGDLTFVPGHRIVSTSEKYL